MNQSHRKPLSECLVSVVLPLYNEADALEQLHRLIGAGCAAACRYEIIFVNDGSRDGGAEILDQLAAADPCVKALHLSRNFGHQSAVQAGLAHAQGDCVIVMDADLQDDPAGIASFLEKWQAGYDVVYAVRVGRKEGPIKRLLFYSFYRVLNFFSNTPMPSDAGNFGLLDGRVAREIAGLDERDRYFAGLRSWVGYRQTGVPVERGERYDDRPRVSLVGLFRLAKVAIISFSSLPLTVFYLIAAASMLVCVGLVIYALYDKLVSGTAIPMWASIIITASFFGAINALGIGILGEYVVRIYDQVRRRPMYVVARRVNCDPAEDEQAADADQRQNETATL